MSRVPATSHSWAVGPGKPRPKMGKNATQLPLIATEVGDSLSCVELPSFKTMFFVAFFGGPTVCFG